MAGNDSDGGDSGSGSDSSGSRSRSVTPATAPTPGYTLDHHDPASPASPKSGSVSRRSRSGTPHRNSGSHSRSRSPSGGSRSNSGSRSRSATPKSRSTSAQSRRSGSPDSRHSNASCRSGVSAAQSHHSKRSGSRSRKGSRTPPASLKSVKNDVEGQQTPIDEDSRSQSPNLQIDDSANSRSRSHSRSGSRERVSKSPSPRKPRSASRSRSGTPKSRSSSRSRSRSRSHTRSPSGSGSESGSESGGDDSAAKKRKVASSGSASEQETAKEDDVATKAKKSRLIDSESEEEQQQEVKKLDAQDIFGDADDISVSEDEKSNVGSDRGSRSRRSRSKSKTHSPRSGSSRHSTRSRSRSKSHSPRSRSGDRDKQPKEDEPEAIPEMTRIDVEIPRIVTDLGKEIHFVKLPNFLSVDTRPFDTETYEDEIDEEETMDEEGRQRIKLKVSNTIRWREFMNNKGEMIKESNARFVRWSDGSLTLHLGNETFDVYRQPLHGDHNHMFIRQGTGLQGQAVFRTKLTFRPHSTESFTHKKMTMSLADRSQKTSGIKILTQVGKDPTTDRLYNLKKEEEKLKQAMRSQNRPQPKKKKAAGVHDVHVGGANSSYHHDDGSDDENAISLSAIKNRYKKGSSAASAAGSVSTIADNKGSAIYSSDEDDGSDFETRRSKRTDKSKAVKALRDSDSESDAGAGNEKNNQNEEGSADEDGQTKNGSGSGSGVD